MNENEKNVTEVQETQSETPPEKELTPEEKLAERERVLAEREKAFEISKLKSKAADSLKEKDIPTELADFLDYESEETMMAGIEKLAEIINNNYAKSMGMTVNLGFQHGSIGSGNSSDNFLNGLRN